MGPLTESPDHVAAFYDTLAPSYDAMTGFENRFVVEKPFFRLLVNQHAIATAVDAGSGTGFHSILLAQLGVAVTAVDVSEEMVSRTKAHAAEAGVRVTAVRSDFEHLAEYIRQPVDAVFCLGNSLAHLTSADQLRSALENFRDILKPGGLLMIQVLNYDRILAERTRIQSIKEMGETMFVRFYDFVDPEIVFNLLTIRRGADGLHHKLSSVLLRPVLADRVAELLVSSGFAAPLMYGSIALEAFRREESRDLVLLARKNG